MPSATNEIGIAFSPNVKVTTTDMLKPTLTGLLSKVDSIAVSIFVVSLVDFDKDEQASLLKGSIWKF